MFGKIISGIIGGLIVASLGALVVTIALASDPAKGGQTGVSSFFIFWIAAIVIAISAPRAGKAWRRLLVTSSILSLAMPISSFIFTGTQVTEAAEHSGAAVAGAALGGGIITAISGFLGFFLGAIFLIIGLLVGRDKKIVVLKENGNEK